jgi:glucosyl-3-phosphoglycerate synthase
MANLMPVDHDSASRSSHDSLEEWFERNTFRLAEQPDLGKLRALKAEQGLRVAIVLPTKSVVATLPTLITEIRALMAPEVGLVDDFVVVDADSKDGTVEVAAEHGVTLLQESGLLPEFGPARGKGDALWRGASAVREADILVFLDSDTENFSRDFVVGLLWPMLVRPEIAFIKGAFARPFTVGQVRTPSGGGRVTELLVRPLLNAFFPELSGFVQPLAGEFAVRRECFESIRVMTGYAVEIGMLIDVWAEYGLDSMAQVHLGSRLNRHQSVEALSVMSHEVGTGLLVRAHEYGRMSTSTVNLTLRPHTLPRTEFTAEVAGLTEWTLDVRERPRLGTVLAELVDAGVQPEAGAQSA